MSLPTARDHLRVAQRLRTRPLIAAAFERGELSYSKVRALMRLDEDFDERQMLGYALHASASQIETIVRGSRRCVAVEAGADRQFAERSFSWSYDDEGGVVFSGRLPAEQGALVVRALEAARDQLGPPPAETGEGQPWDLAELTTSPAARRGDAFVAVAQSALAERVSSAARRSRSGARRGRSRLRSGAHSRSATTAARSPAAASDTTSTPTTSSTGPTAAGPTWTTSSSSAATTTRSSTKGSSGSSASPTAAARSSVRTEPSCRRRLANRVATARR